MEIILNIGEEKYKIRRFDNLNMVIEKEYYSEKKDIYLWKTEAFANNFKSLSACLSNLICLEEVAMDKEITTLDLISEKIEESTNSILKQMEKTCL